MKKNWITISHALYIIFAGLFGTFGVMISIRFINIAIIISKTGKSALGVILGLAGTLGIGASIYLAVMIILKTLKSIQEGKTK